MKKLLSIILSAVIAVSASSLACAKTAKPGAPKVKSVSAVDSRVLKISWTKVSKAKGYVLYRKTSDSAFKKIVSVSKTSYTNKKLKSGITYYYKVKAYKTKNGKKIYSKFSNIKSKKAKIIYSAEDMYKKSVKDILKIMGNKFEVKKGDIETFYYFRNYKKLPGMDFYFNVKWGDTEPVKNKVKNGKIKIEGIQVNKNGLGLRRNGKMIKAGYDYKKCSKALGKITCTPSGGAFLSGAVSAVGYTITTSKYHITINFTFANKPMEYIYGLSGNEKFPYNKMIEYKAKIKNIVINKNYG